jgi:hypothetical protein
MVARTLTPEQRNLVSDIHPRPRIMIRDADQ